VKTLVIGLDAFDPRIFERLSAGGRLPNLTQYADLGGYAPLEVANPPQSEVSWTSIATGLNPGRHGIFDFVQRDPETYGPYLSLLQTKRDVLGTRFIPPHTATTIFEEVARRGYPATVLWWPATFPARPEIPVRTVPGLGTPDIQGRLGVGVVYTSDPASFPQTRKTPVVALRSCGADCYQGTLEGPVRKGGGDGKAAEQPFSLQVTGSREARLTIEKQTFSLTEGQWSPILELSFRLGLFVRLYALTRVLLTQTAPEVHLYVMPLQIHPLHPLWRYAAPASFAKRLWKEQGPFLTLGMPQDTTALEDGCIDEQQFLALCDDIFARRSQIFLSQLQNFREGLLAAVFDSLDRIQHVFWARRPEVVEAWYVKLDALIGQIGRELMAAHSRDAKIVILSDHGIADYHHKVHLNRWLLEEGYLCTTSSEAVNGLQAVDWSRTQAYALGLNSVYLNLAGRESQGLVLPEEAGRVLQALKAKLLGWKSAAGDAIVSGVWRREEAFEGSLTAHGPDLVVGYARGFRASPETGLGKWAESSVVENRDLWSADHCMDYREVPGVLFTNQSLDAYASLSYRDIPALTIGTAPTQNVPRPPQAPQGEGRDEVERRLESLGYL